MPGQSPASFARWLISRDFAHRLSSSRRAWELAHSLKFFLIILYVASFSCLPWRENEALWSSTLLLSLVKCFVSLWVFSLVGYKVQFRSFSSNVPPWIRKWVLVGVYFHDNARVSSKQNKQTITCFVIYYRLYTFICQSNFRGFFVLKYKSS